MSAAADHVIETVSFGEALQMLERCQQLRHARDFALLPVAKVVAMAKRQNVRVILTPDDSLPNGVRFEFQSLDTPQPNQGVR